MTRLLIFLFSFFSLTLSAQLPQKDFYFRQLNTTQGMSYSAISDMLKDKEGFLWVGTFNGLNCFDGSHFKVWKANPGDTNALPNNVIESLCEDDKSNIWCATDAGVSRFDRNKFKNYPLRIQSSGTEKTTMAYEIIFTKTREIIASTPNGVFIYDSLSDGFNRYTGKKNEGAVVSGYIYKNAFVEDTLNHGIWMGTEAGMRFLDLNNRVYYKDSYNPGNIPVLNSHVISTLAMDKHNRLVYYDVTEKNIVTYDPKTKTITKQSTDSWDIGNTYFATIFIDNDDNKWISTWQNKSYFIDGTTGKVFELLHQIENNYSIAAGFFWDAMQDKDGTLYIGSINGISYTNVKENYFSIHKLPAGIHHTTEYFAPLALGVDRQNNIWLAPNWNYLLKYNVAEDRYTKYDFLPEAKKKIDEFYHVSSLYATEDTLYFGTLDGIYVFDIRTEKFSRLKVMPESDFKGSGGIVAMLRSRDNELWFASIHGGLFRYNISNHSYKHYVHDSLNEGSITQKLIVDIHENNDGTIWLAAAGDGLIKYNAANDNFIYLTKTNPDEVFKSDFYKIQNDKEGNLWLLNVQNGLIRFNPKTGDAKKMFSGSGMSDIVYGSMLLNDDGKIWLGFYYHFTIYDIATNTSENFEVDYSKDNLGYINNFFKLADNRIVSDSRDAFIILDPAKRNRSHEIEPVIISGFKSGTTELNFLNHSKPIELSYRQSSFSFDFSTMSFLKNDNIHFAYMLEGFDDKWIECGSRQTAYFTNINGGNYTFRVRAQGPDGTWNECKNPASITITNIFYTTTWFRLLLFLSLVLCVAWYINVLKKRALKRDSDKAISYFANSLQGKNKVDELLWDITHNVITRTNLVDCVVYLLDKEKNVLVQKAAFGDKNPENYEILNPLEIPVGSGIVGSVAEKGKTEVIGDTSKDARYIADDTPRLSELTVPIIAEGKVIGVIDAEHPNRNFFTKEHVQLLETIASITATKIIRAQKEMEVEEKEKRLSDLRIQMSETRQQALQAQMNPHFIFNCLNSINGFILQNDAATASTFLIKFSKLIRLILEHSNEKSVSLQSELDALKLYIEMEALRFEKKFSYRINVDENLETESIQVPPLIFQPFVENSIWHGLLHKEGTGELSIKIKGSNTALECIIEDNGIGREASAAFKSKTSTHKKSLGLKLTTERLALLNQNSDTLSSVKVEDVKDQSGKISGTRVTITIPVINELI